MSFTVITHNLYEAMRKKNYFVCSARVLQWNGCHTADEFFEWQGWSSWSVCRWSVGNCVWQWSYQCSCQGGLQTAQSCHKWRLGTLILWETPLIIIKLQGCSIRRESLSLFSTALCQSDGPTWCVLAMRHHYQSVPSMEPMGTWLVPTKMTLSLFVQVNPLGSFITGCLHTYPPTNC